jgi:hypothetical protein
MSEIQLDNRIKRAGDLATTAFQYLHKLQTEKSIVKTGQEFIDVHLQGVLPSDVILYAGNSGTGKTKLLYDTLDSILDENVNKDASNYVTLQYELEMRFLNKILRDTHSITSRKKSEILSKEFSEEDKELVKRYYEGLKDNRRFICEETINTDDFLKMTDDFCALNKHKSAIWCTLDHCLLVQKSSPNEDVAERLTAHINTLRKKYNNVYFILLSQNNRSSMAVIKDRDNAMIPTTSIIYGSSHFEFLASFIVVITDPFKMGINSYLKVNPDRYDWLSEFMEEPDKNGKVSFSTLANHFIWTLKTRESDEPYKNLHIRPMTLSSEQINKMKQSVDKTNNISFTSAPTFNTTPVFEKTVSEIVPPISFDQLSSVFGDGDATPPF